MSSQTLQKLLNKYLGGSKILIRNENSELFKDLSNLLSSKSIDVELISSHISHFAKNSFF